MHVVVIVFPKHKKYFLHVCMMLITGKDNALSKLITSFSNGLI